MATLTVTTTATRIELVTDLEVAEYDKAGILKATYVESEFNKASKRVDVIRPRNDKGLIRKVIDIFLPDGYPNCVTDDYTSYQVYDSLQALAGSIAGMISSRAVWEGIGVGNSSASPTGAVLITVARECFGRLATITFAHAMGTSIEAECKAHRLISDVYCDVAMILDCLSLSLPPTFRLPVLCVSSTLFAASGVAGRASKSSLSAHFAKWNNIAELNATESSQETAITLLGMLIGSTAVYILPNRTATWFLLLFLLAVHLLLNYAAVRAVKMRTISRQRANILFSNLAEKGRVLHPENVSRMESMFERRGGSVFRWLAGPVLGHCDFGVPLQKLVQCLPQSHLNTHTASTRLSKIDLSTVTNLFGEQQYLLWCQPYAPHWYESSTPQTKTVVVLKQGITPESQLRAWYHALLLVQRLSQPRQERKPGILEGDLLHHVRASLDLSNKTFDVFAQQLRVAGWELGVPVLETRLGSRIVCKDRKCYTRF